MTEIQGYDILCGVKGAVSETQYKNERSKDMSKKHMEDNTQYIDEERRAPTKLERKALEAALDEMGMKKSLGKDAVLVGRQDEPYGWYLLDLGDCVGDGKGRYLILGDCLDVLPDYDKLLTLKEVHSFAFGESDGRFEAMQKWGVFKGISDKLWHKATDAGVEFTEQSVEWSEEAEEWKICYCIRWEVCDGLHGNTAISIPANLASREEADRAFIADLENAAVTETSAEYIVARLKGKKSPAAKMIKEAWVLTTIDAEGKVYPEIHLRFVSCVDRVFDELNAHTDSFDEYDIPAMRKELEGNLYLEDAKTGFKFVIALCPVCD